MKINLEQVFKNRKGGNMTEEGALVTLGSVAYTGLVAQYPDEQNLSRDEKMKRGRLAQRLCAAEGEIDLKAEEITLLKTCIGKGYGPWIVVQSEDMLESPQLRAVEDAS